MAISRAKTWVSAEILLAADLNAEFNNILNNATSLISPLTATLDIDNQRLDDINAGTVGDPSLNPNGDSNTGFYFPAGDQFAVSVGGTQAFVSTTTYTNFPDLLFCNETANANMAIGWTGNQSTNDDQAFCLKSTTDVVTGLTTLPIGNDVETDDWYAISKRAGSTGGAEIFVGAEAASAIALRTEVFAGTPGTDDITSSVGMIIFVATEHDDANGLTAATAGANIFAVNHNSSAGNLTRLILKEDGTLHLGVGGVSPTDIDDYNDAELVRTMMLASNLDRKGIIESKWDEFITYNHDTLVDVGVLGRVPSDAPEGTQGLLNIHQLFRLHNGAIWQLYTQNKALEQRLLALEGPHA